jgi:hypothetical protein
MANPPAVIDAPSAETVTVEAATIEEALAQISVDLGPDARILSADRVRRGGIGGFFAKEVVEVRVEPVSAPGKGVNAAFDQLLAAAETQHEAPAGDPGIPAGTPPVSPAPPAATPTAASATFGAGAPVVTVGAGAPVVTVDWQAARVLEMGLPDVLAHTIGSLDPTDDLAHVNALAATFSGVCGPLPPGAGRLVGERAGRLRAAVDIPEAPDGYIHLVVGDELPDSLPGVPAVVSWVSDRGAARAISLALGTGARLGYGMSSAFASPARRISPVDAALAVRDLMERP